MTTIESKEREQIKVTDERVGEALEATIDERRTEVADRVQAVEKKKSRGTLAARRVMGLTERRERKDVPFYIETLGSEELTDEIVKELADLFRFAFNNEYGEHVVCQPCNIQQAAWQTFGREEGAIVPLEEMDTLSGCPNCPECGEKMDLNHDPDRTIEKLNKKFQSGALVSMLRDKETNELQGVNFAYVTTLRKAFEEEWKTPYGYTKEPNPVSFRDFEAFMQGVESPLKEELQSIGKEQENITPEDQVFCWNCTITKPEVRGKGGLQAIFEDFWAHLPEDVKENLILVGEAQTGSKYYNIVIKAGLKGKEGVLSDGYSFMYRSLKQFIDRPEGEAFEE